MLLYCTRYFSDDEPALGRFAALLLAFAGVMFGLVTADDVFILFTFWEATSVLSYLLIGHYTGRKESRGAALQALTVTTFGGLAMLVGLVILSVAGGTTSLAELIANPVTGAAGEWAIALILVGAISKSALVPFHFWLPAAMAAPTPVSAYLHAAAMVKAGVYLVARLAPGYADLEVWHPIVIGLGAFTMLVGGWRALRQYDLKLLLAYGTVSQLGFLVMVTGFGTRDAALAGVALLLAHALFKASLFLVVGIVDHAAGTRDWRKLSGLGRRMPVVATIAFVAAGSMAGVPPLLGFVAKEAVFTAFLDAVVAGEPWAWVALVGAFAGSVLTVAYSARFLWGAFFTRADVPPTPLHREGALISTAPALLSAASVVFAFTVPLIEPLLAAYADTLPGSQEYHLALWHGLEPALALSAAVFALAALLIWGRRRVARMQAAMPPTLDAARGYLGIVSVVDRVAAALTTAIQHRGLPGYLAIIVTVFIGGLGAATVMNTAWPDGIRLWDYPAQPFLAFIMGIAGIAAATVKQRMTAVLLVSVTGYGLVLLFGMSGAPDLALTQALVETIVLVVFVLVLRRLPRQIAQRNPPVHKVARGIIGALAGIVMGVIGLVALGARIQPTIAEGLPGARHRGARQEHRQRDARRHPGLGHARRDRGARRGGHRRREPDLRLGPHRRRPATRPHRARRPGEPPRATPARARGRVEHPRAPHEPRRHRRRDRCRGRGRRHPADVAPRRSHPVAPQSFDPHRSARAAAVPPGDHRVGLPALRRSQRPRRRLRGRPPRGPRARRPLPRRRPVRAR